MYKDVNDFVTTNFMVFNDAMIENVIILTAINQQNNKQNNWFCLHN